jgi:hypothetical protein
MSRASFYESLLRVSLIKYKSIAPTLALQALLKQHIFPLALSHAPHDLNHKLLDVNVSKVFASYKEKLLKLFRHYTSNSSNSNNNSNNGSNGSGGQNQNASWNNGSGSNNNNNNLLNGNSTMQPATASIGGVPVIGSASALLAGVTTAAAMGGLSGVSAASGANAAAAAAAAGGTSTRVYIPGANSLSASAILLQSATAFNANKVKKGHSEIITLRELENLLVVSIQINKADKQTSEAKRKTNK